MTAAAAMATPLKKRCSDAGRLEGLSPCDEVANVVTDVFYHRRVRAKCHTRRQRAADARRASPVVREARVLLTRLEQIAQLLTECPLSIHDLTSRCNGRSVLPTPHGNVSLRIQRLPNIQSNVGLVGRATYVDGDERAGPLVPKERVEGLQ